MDAVGDWARRAAIRISDGAAGLAVLEGPLARSEAVFLGELNHFVHEKGAFRLAMARRLAPLGWTAFAEELGCSDGVRVQQYLDTGDEAHLDRLVTFGFEDHRRPDRPDRMGGILKPSVDSYPVQRFKAEQTRFYRGLRTLGRVSLRGVDIDALPGGAYDDVARRLGPGADMEALQRVEGESAPEEAARVRRAAKRFADPEVVANLEAMADSLDYVARTYDAADYEALRPGMALREDCMKRRAAAALAMKPAGAKGLVFMAHAFHLAKDDRLFDSKAIGVGPGGGLVPSLGHHLVQEKGLKAYSIWMVYGEGEDSQPFPDLPRRADYPQTSLNRRLALFDEPVLLPLADAPAVLMEAPIGVGHMYNAVVPTRLKGQVDAIYFAPRVTPLRG